MNTTLDVALSEAKNVIGETDDLVRVVLSGRRKAMQPPANRIDIRPVLIKERLMLQVSENDGRQTQTSNHDPKEFEVGALLRSGFSNILIEHIDGSMSIRITKKDDALVHRERGEFERNLDHDRSKKRLLDPSDPYLKEVGISDHLGRVKPSRQDKYKQVEEFLRLLVPALSAAFQAGQIAKPSDEQPLRIIDLGCGNAYLTFAVHQYFRSQSIPVHVTGIDVRPESRLRNTKIAAKLEIASTIDFYAEEISQSSVKSADVVIALHACDTATDDAIAWAVDRGTKLMLVAPCCHHDLQKQVGELNEVPEPWKLVTKHGFLRERFIDLLTDSLRAQILKMVGYRTEIIEFIGDAHTPRNLMIRAVKTGSQANEQDRQRYEDMVSLWEIKPALAVRLEKSLKEAGIES